jgi:hypothetical protein
MERLEHANAGFRSLTESVAIAAARKVFQNAIAKGHARENMTSVVRLFTEPK